MSKAGCDHRFVLLQECSATLPNLPNQEQLTQLIHQKEEERKKRLQRELEEAQV